ncbi:MAG: 1-acyl-sn-glycerol-3-phosphate acyltransferase [Pseudobutyrivibrio sp.]|nr:1-acyl-sn-glycerol-3-phosphate acyltransferase [Pseudobutyrivibrio sp.]
MLRTIITVLFVFIFLILSIPVWGLLLIVGLFDKHTKDVVSYKIVAWAFGIVAFLAGVKYEVYGYDKIPADKSVLFIGNHHSYFDVVLGYHICPAVTGFLAKQEIGKIPLLRTWMKMNYCLFLTRTDPRTDLKLMLKAQDYIKEGISMFVFPEGTRSKDGQMGEFHDASFRMSLKTGAPIIPVVFTNTRSIFEAQAPRIKKSHVIVTFMDPIYPENLEAEDKKHIGQYVKSLMQDQADIDAKKVF